MYKIVPITLLEDNGKEESFEVLTKFWRGEKGRRCSKYIAKVIDYDECSIILDLLNSQPPKENIKGEE